MADLTHQDQRRPQARPLSTADTQPGSYCAQCGYALHGLSTSVCPECGRGFDPDDPKTYHDLQRNPEWARMLGLLLLVGGIAAVVNCAYRGLTAFFDIGLLWNAGNLSFEWFIRFLVPGLCSLVEIVAASRILRSAAVARKWMWVLTALAVGQALSSQLFWLTNLVAWRGFDPAFFVIDCVHVLMSIGWSASIYIGVLIFLHTGPRKAYFLALNER